MREFIIRCSICNAQLNADMDDPPMYCPYCGNELSIPGVEASRQAQISYEYAPPKRGKEHRSTTLGNNLPTVVALLLVFIAILYFGSQYLKHKQNVALLQQLEVEIEAAIQENDYERAIVMTNRLYLDDNYSKKESDTWDAKRQAILEIIAERKHESDLADPDKIFLPGDSSFFKGKYYEDVVDQLSALGFTSISTQIASKAPGLFHRTGTIEHILIGGKTEFSTEEYFDKNTPIIIYYYSKDKH